MKRLLLVILCIFLLCGCQAADKMVLTPADPVDPPSNIRIGMTFDEFYELYPERGRTPDGKCYYQYMDYAFFEDADGNPVVVRFVREGNYFTVGSVYAYDKNGINKTETVFDTMERGMSVQKMVSLVGLPDPITLSYPALIWNLDGDVQYHIQLTAENRDFDKGDYVLSILTRWDGDVASYPIGEEPLYAPEPTKP